MLTTKREIDEYFTLIETTIDHYFNMLITDVKFYYDDILYV